jgi:very-short-patch-repair endonuclease
MRLLRRENLGCRFRRQHPIGPYIADFASVDPRVVIEVDGGQHAEQSAYDKARDDFMRAQGFVVLRFWSNEVLLQTDAVLEVIIRAIEARKSPPSCPSPATAGEGT